MINSTIQQLNEVVRSRKYEVDVVGDQQNCSMGDKRAPEETVEQEASGVTILQIEMLINDLKR